MIESNPKHLVGQSITLVGLAENAHQGALVTLADGCEVYVIGVRRWDKALLGKRVKVTGRLQCDKLAPDPEVNARGEVSHGMWGSLLIVEEAIWELA